MLEFGPDWIVAIGGGSPIDAAKAMWIKYEYPTVTFEDMCKVFGLPKLRTKAHFCAVSSTSGTAFDDYGAHIIHGAANAMYLPKVIAFNAKNPEALKRYGEIADYMNLGGNTDEEKVQLLIKALRKMNDDLNIPHCIKNYGLDSYPTENGFVPEEVFLERLPEIAKNAIADACTGSNPRIPTQKEMEELLKCCYYDTEVNF